MSVDHYGGNIQNEILREEHDGVNNAKRVSIVAGGLSFGGLVTLGSSPSFIGIVTVANQTGATLSGNVTLNPSPNFIGIVTVANPGSASLNGNVTLDPGSRTGIVGNVTISDSKTFIGLVTATLGASPAFIGIVTVANSQANTGNVTLNSSPNFIGIVTVANASSIGGGVQYQNGASNASVYGTVAMFWDSNSNVARAASYSTPFPIDLRVSNSQISAQLVASSNFVGIVTIANTNLAQESGGNLASMVGSLGTIDSTLSTISSSVATESTLGSINAALGAAIQTEGAAVETESMMAAGYDGTNTRRLRVGTDGRLQANVTINNPLTIAGNLTLSDPKGFIGLVTAVGNFTTTFSGNVTLDAGSKTGIVGNVTLSDPKTYIGLVTLGGGTAWTDPKTYIGLVTATMAGSVNTGMTTIFPGPNQIGSVTVSHPVSLAGNVTLSDSKTYIGLVTATVGNNPVLGAGVNSIGFATVQVANNIGIVGNLTLSDPKGFIGLVTVVQSNSVRSIVGNITLSDSKTFIGLTTSTLGASGAFIGIVTVANPGTANLTGNVTLDPGSKTGIVGNVTLSDSKTFIGLVSVGGGYLTTYPQVWNGAAFEAVDRTVFIGLTTSVVSSITPGTSPTNLGKPLAGVATSTDVGVLMMAKATDTPGVGVSEGQYNSVRMTTGGELFAQVSGSVVVSEISSFAAKVGIAGNMTLSDSKTYIGLTTTTLGVGDRFIGLVTVVQSSSARTITGNITLSDSKTYIGLTTTTLGVGTTFIGLVTASSLNAGTTKTILTLPVAFSASSIATVFVPTNANRVFVTNMVLNANATTRVTLRSGATYLTGNASIGVTLSPMGGFVLAGSPDSPSWIGLPSGALIIEKLDLTATAAAIAGHVNYYQEA